MPIYLWKSNEPLCPLAISDEVQLCRNMNTSEFDGSYTPGITPFVSPQADLQQALLLAF